MSDGNHCACTQAGKNWHAIFRLIDATLAKDSLIRIYESSIAFSYIDLVVFILLQYKRFHLKWIDTQ